MKRYKNNSKLEFDKQSIIELNDLKQISIVGGTNMSSGVCVNVAIAAILSAPVGSIIKNESK